MDYAITRNPGHCKGKQKFTITKGEPVIIHGFEEFEFFRHAPYPGDEHLGEVVISERTTGAVVSRGSSFSDAYALAIHRLIMDGIKGFRRRVEEYRLMLIK